VLVALTSAVRVTELPGDEVKEELGLALRDVEVAAAEAAVVMLRLQPPEIDPVIPALSLSPGPVFITYSSQLPLGLAPSKVEPRVADPAVAALPNDVGGPVGKVS
jgi:hypothetical protein